MSLNIGFGSMIRTLTVCFLVLLYINIVYGAEDIGEIIIMNTEIQMGGVAIKDRIHENENQLSIERNITIGSVINRSSGGTSIIEIGTIGGNNQIKCDFNNTHDNGMDNQNIIIGDNKTVNIDQDWVFDLCIKGTKNKVYVAQNNQIGVIVIEGSSNSIHISEEVNIEKIRFSGIQNVVLVPHSMKVNMVDRGVGNKVTRY